MRQTEGDLPNIEMIYHLYNETIEDIKSIIHGKMYYTLENYKRYSTEGRSTEYKAISVISCTKKERKEIINLLSLDESELKTFQDRYTTYTFIDKERIINE